jgi:phosphatidylserine/phosphatidylglycerophosphate/cardiolipin synthase-like enzyme
VRKITKALLASFLLILTFSCAPPQKTPISFEPNQARVFFSPQDGCAKEVVSQLDNAKKSIYIAMYFFTSRDMAQALVRAKQRGLDVKVCLNAPDKSSEYDKYSKDVYLKNNGIPVKPIKGKGIMHNKFCVIDEALVLTGSYNWTKRAEAENDENMLVINSSEIAKIYKEEFDRIYSGKKSGILFSYKDSLGVDKIPLADIDGPAKPSSQNTGYVGSKKSMKLHYSNCEWAEKINPSNKIEFKNREDAIKNGYSPCKVCSP